MTSLHHDPDDDALDERLRRVPLPEGLAARAAGDLVFGDEAIDRILGRVPVPGGLMERLREALHRPGGARREVDLEQASAVILAALPPSANPPSDHGGAARPAGRSLWMQASTWTVGAIHDFAVVAAALLVIAGMFIAGTEVSRRLAADSDPGRRFVGRRADPRPVARLTPSALGRGDGVGNDGIAARSGNVRASDPGVPATGDSPPPVKDRHVASVEPAPVVLGAPGASVSASRSRSGRASPAGGMRIVPPLDETRRCVPWERGFDLAFEMQHGEAPFVDPAAAPSLARDRPPLSPRTDSFDSLVAAVRSRRTPDADRGRAEHVLAAIPPRESAAGEPVRLTIHAVQSLRRNPQTILAEVVVTTALPSDTIDASRDEVVVLDRSAMPGGDVAWRALCRGLVAVADQMRPIDRLSVVVAGERPEVVVERADADGVRQVGIMLQRQVPRGTADIDAALRLVGELSLGRQRQMTVVTHLDSIERARDQGREAYAAWQREAVVDPDAGTHAGVRFLLIDLVGSFNPDPAAPAPRGVVADSAAIRRGMVQAVCGRSTLALRGCRLEVEFNPARVAGYRLVGHRHAAVDSVAAADVAAIDLHVGETVRAVYEVTLRGADDWLLAASFTGHAANGGESLRRSATLMASDVESIVPLPSPHACELVFGFELADAWGRSAHASPRRRDPHAVGGLAQAWRSRGDVTAFGHDAIDCLQQQSRLAPSSSTPGVPDGGTRR